MTRRTHTTDITAISRDMTQNIAYFRERFQRSKNPEADKRWAEIETFIAIALRVMERTNPSKLRDVARTLEIKSRLHGVEVIEQ